MKTTLAVENPGEVMFTLTLTMTLKHWLELQAQLPKQWPAWDLSSKITDMAMQAKRKFWPGPDAEL